MPNRSQFEIGVTDALHQMAYKLHLEACLDRKSRVGLVYSELFFSRRKAKARLAFLKTLSNEGLLALVKIDNPFVADLTPSLIVDQARQDALARYGSWEDDGDGGGIGARLSSGPRGPRVAAYEEPWPKSGSYEYEEFGLAVR